MIPVALAHSKDSKELHTVESIIEPEHGRILVTESQARSHGVWVHSKITTQTTTNIASAIPGGAIVLTDLVVNVDRTNSLTLVIRFGDGTNNEILFEPDVNNLQFNEVFQPQGFFGGWKGANLQAVTGGANGETSITVGYYHLRKGMEYSTWDSLR